MGTVNVKKKPIIFSMSVCVKVGLDSLSDDELRAVCGSRQQLRWFCQKRYTSVDDPLKMNRSEIKLGLSLTLV